jgi:4'-phosphopantetheinyl transferase
MRGDTVPEVHLGIVPRAATRELDHIALTTFAARVLSTRVPVSALTHRCPECGSSAHGTPHLTVDGLTVDGVTIDGVTVDGVTIDGVTVDGVTAVTVSLSRAAGLVVFAVATGCDALGVDLESLEATTRAGFDDVAFGPEERAELASTDTATTRTGRMRLAGWTAKEALLKAAATGLRTDPRALRLTWPPPATPAPAQHPSRLPDAWAAAPAPALVDGSAAGIDATTAHLSAVTCGPLTVTVAVFAERAPRIRIVTAR